MFSKEWKLAAFSLLAAVVLTACPQKKKKAEATRTTYWVNADAYQHLNGLGFGQNPRICAGINQAAPYYWGIDSDPYGEQLLLDAWAVTSSGAVFLYTPSFNSLTPEVQKMYLMGHVSGTAFKPKNAIRPGPYGSYQGGASYCSAPFKRGGPGTTVRYQESYMVVYSPGPCGPYQSVQYVQVSYDQLVQMSQAISYCTGSVNFDRRQHYPRHGGGYSYGGGGGGQVIIQQPQPQPYMAPGGQMPPGGQMGPQVPPQDFGNGYPYPDQQNQDQRQGEQDFNQQPLPPK